MLILVGTQDFRSRFQSLGRFRRLADFLALNHYNLAEQVPGEIWIVVPHGKGTRVRGYKLIRTKTRLDKEITEEKGYRIVTVERKVLEAFKFITKIGAGTAIKAARESLAQRKASEAKLARSAKELGLEVVLAKYLEVIPS